MAARHPFIPALPVDHHSPITPCKSNSGFSMSHRERKWRRGKGELGGISAKTLHTDKTSLSVCWIQSGASTGGTGPFFLKQKQLDLAVRICCSTSNPIEHNLLLPPNAHGPPTLLPPALQMHGQKRRREKENPLEMVYSREPVLAPSLLSFLNGCERTDSLGCNFFGYFSHGFSCVFPRNCCGKFQVRCQPKYS